MKKSSSGHLVVGEAGRLFLAIWIAIQLFLWPSPALAYEVWEGPSHLVVATQELHRLRFQGSLWQLSGELAEPLIASQVFAGRLWLIIGSRPRAQLAWTLDGLTINFPNLPIGDWRLDNLGMELLASTAGQTWRLTDPTNPRVLEEYLAKPTWTIRQSSQGSEGPGWLVRDGSLIWFVSFANGQARRLFAQVCLEPKLYSQARILGCSNDQLFYRLTKDGWQRLNLPALNLASDGGMMLVGLNQQDRNQLVIWQLADATHRLFRLPPLVIKRIEVKGTRIFLQTETNWQELDWSSSEAKLIVASPDHQATIIAEGSWLFFNGSMPIASRAMGDYRPLETAGAFNQVRQFGDRWLIWQTDHQKQSGGLTQVSPDPPAKFQKFSGVWSTTTSPIQAIQETSNGWWVIVITNSGRGNANLYHSTDLATWKRLALPTKPTLVRTIAQIRQLPAGSLVEVQGLATVEKDQLASNIFYLQDQTAGIQVFASKDLAKPVRYRRLQLPGEISSAKTKRLIIAAPEEVVVLGSERPSWPKTTFNQIASRLGEALTVEGRVDQLEKESFMLAFNGNFLKVHLPEAKTKLATGDQVELSVIADLNGSTELIELWSPGDQLVLTKPAARADPLPTSQIAPSSALPNTEQSPAPPPPTATPSTKSPVSRSTRSTSSISAGAPIASQPPPDQATLIKSIASQPKESGGNPAKKPKTVNGWALPLGFSAGALAIRGRRTRRLLVGPESIDSFQ